ncbi:hypothetical protein BDN70DRAFT_861510 [Pholiota conissans]|uniref:Uncharacterized protein n=1 Tax=Pholiota conissans TaxID=109636 RepID=A0A9P5YYS6_9AGAR|nr:hypothetical protein BDN70DRAFT_861510 [Pholiota conissans]
MNNNDEVEDHAAHVDKGKRRAVEPSELTPLLGSSSAIIDEAIVPADSHRNLRTTLTTVFLVSLSVCIVFFVVIALLAWSYASRASNLKPDDVLNNDLVFAGPDRVDVLNVTKEGVWLNVQGRVGMDAGRAININTDPDDGPFRDLWKAIGRWSVRTLDRVSVNMSTINITPEYDSSIALVSLDIAPIELPLSVDPPPDLSWLTPVSVPVYFRLTSNSTEVLQFLKESWHVGKIAVRADVSEAHIRGGSLNTTSWRSNFQTKLLDIRTAIHMKIPPIPGLPHPGKHLPLPSLSSLITLKSFNISSTPTQLNIDATASIFNPAPTSLSLSAPSLSFIVSLPTTPPTFLASVSSAPFSLTYPNITLSLSGHVLPLTQSAFPFLAEFLSRYLSGEPNEISISSPLLPGYDISAEFPAPQPRPQILRDVTIKDMKIRPTGTVFLASGIVEGRVVLPKGMNISLDVSYVLPDVLVFDGEVPPAPEPDYATSRFVKHRGHHGSAPDLPEEPPLPDPLPDRAFAHIRPDEWLPAVSSPSEAEDGVGSVYAISARVVDVPLEVLPGRQKEFSNFVGKVIFGTDGATAGILGSAAVAVTVEGLPLNTPGRKTNEIVLSGLPFQGSVHIKKR